MVPEFTPVAAYVYPHVQYGLGVFTVSFMFLRFFLNLYPSALREVGSFWLSFPRALSRLTWSLFGNSDRDRTMQNVQLRSHKREIVFYKSHDHFFYFLNFFNIYI